MSDYGDDLPVASSDLGLLGAGEMKDFANLLKERADQRLLRLELNGQSQNSNVVENLRIVSTKAVEIINLLGNSNMESSNSLAEANEVYFSLLDQKAFFERASSVLKDVQSDFSKSPQNTPNPDFLLTYFGRPLLHGVHYDNYYFENTNRTSREVYYYFKPSEILRIKKRFQKVLLTKLQGVSPTELNDLQELFNQAAELSAMYEQEFLNLGATLGSSETDFKRKTNQVLHMEKLFVIKHSKLVEGRTNTVSVCTNSIPKQPNPEPSPCYDAPNGEPIPEDIHKMFARLWRNGQKARDLLDLTIARINRDFELAELSSKNKTKARYRLIELSRFLKRLTTEDRFHRLAKPANSDTPDSHVSIILKTLFLRYADNLPAGKGTRIHSQRGAPEPIPPSSVEQRNASILVMAKIQSEDLREASNYPIIFAPDYAAGHFVNEVDRFIYGPSPYLGKAMDIRFSVIELRNLNNSNIISGFKAVTGTIAVINPEFAAISPVVNGLFSTILNAATRDQLELDFSFTIPPPEGANKADTDFLIAETGHYILIKSENRYRTGLESQKSSQRDYYRRLIYNPRDGKLYHRKYFTNPELNFEAGNLFTEQSYAVIAITDEYTATDNLGDMLRQQVARRVGDRRAATIIPDEGEAKDLFDTLRVGLGIKSTSTNMSPDIVNNLLASLKQQLWNPISDVRREFNVQILSQHADEATLALLGTDPEKWKTANLKVRENGKISVVAGSTNAETPPTSTFIIYVPSDVVKNPFDDIGGLKNQEFVTARLVDADAIALAVDTNGWWGKIAGKTGNLKPPTRTNELKSSSIQIQAHESDGTIFATRQIVFQGRPFSVTEQVNSNSILFTNSLTIRTNDEVTLEIKASGSDSPADYFWSISNNGDKFINGLATLANCITNKIVLKAKPGVTNASITLRVRHRLFQNLPADAKITPMETITINAKDVLQMPPVVESVAR